jgi:hypothetical protein
MEEQEDLEEQQMVAEELYHEMEMLLQPTR